MQLKRILCVITTSTLLATAAYAAAPVTSIGHAAPSGSDTNRVQRLDNQMQYVMKQLGKVDSIQSQIETLRGQMETLQHQVAQLNQVTQTLSMMENRVIQLEATTRLADGNPKVASSEIDTKQPDGAAFKKAYDLMTQREYKQAITAFESFVKTYPQSHSVTDAYYWLGELYLVQGRPDKATQEFKKVIDNPKSLKTPDAMYKLGMIFLANGDLAHAKSMFTKVVTNYSGTQAAEQAKKQLDSMQ